MSNCLFFADDNGENRWCLIQISHFFNAVFNKDIIFVYNKFGKVVELVVKEILELQVLNFFPKRPNSFGGVVVDQNRPFHYFYDQFINLPDLCLSEVYIKDGCYLSPEILGFNVYKCNENNSYIFPCSVGTRFQFGDSIDLNRPEAFRMENKIKSSISPINQVDKEVFSLWYGITGTKRSLVEQVELIELVSEKLAEKYDEIVLYIDGMTSHEARKELFPEDMEVYRKIKKRIKSKKIKIINMISEDYKIKIKECMKCNAFIANGGFGCFVPLRICGIPGVVHSNLQLFNFPGEYNKKKIVFPSCEYVRELGNGKRADYTSYSIDWRYLFNLFSYIVKINYNVDLGAKCFPHPIHDKFFLAKSEATSAVIDGIRDMAYEFYEKGDRNVALKMLNQAYIYRPAGDKIKSTIMKIEREEGF
ncbi:hypothetical protein HW452_02800 [Halomonas aquamarina]|uniref:Uncharacterized protein n=1 Tax=Vreelandella aquamarina TaxID=77097 RepID=A0ACC5VQ98_9GAMM|nr:hypothetical protein [Halomonas aquamarina]MBZ5486446.1 hypothetical protein [Halomonas aquamarina]